MCVCVCVFFLGNVRYNDTPARTFCGVFFLFSSVFGVDTHSVCCVATIVLAVALFLCVDSSWWEGQSVRERERGIHPVLVANPFLLKCVVLCDNHVRITESGRHDGGALAEH